MLLITALSFQQTPVLPVHFLAGKQSLAVPFELNSGKIYLKVKVEHKGPFWFVLDSGSPSTVVDMSLAKRLGLELTNPGRTGGAGEGSTGVAVTKVKELELNGLDYQPLNPLAIDLDRVMSAPEGRHVQGLVGGDFLSRSVVEIDYAKHLLSFHDPASYHHTGHGYTIPIHLQFGFMMVDASMGLKDGRQLSGRFIVDTGARLTITLNTPFVNANHLISTATPRVVVGSGLGGKVNHGVGRLSWLQVGDAKLPAPVATFSQDKGGVFSASEFQGLIGAELLQRFRVTIDYPEQKLYLDPAGPYPPFTFDASGMFLVAEGSDLRRYEVANVSEGTAASSAGIHEGDVIAKVNGRPASTFTLEQLRELFKLEGKIVKLQLFRGGKPLGVDLKLRKIV